MLQQILPTTSITNDNLNFDIRFKGLIVGYTGCSFKLQLTLAALILNYINRTGTSVMYILLGVKFVTVQSLFSGTGSYAQREIPSRKPVLLRSAAKRMRPGG